MAARYALPSQSFANVQRYLRQKRASGQTVTPGETRLAWQAHWDAMAARSLERQQLGLQATELGMRQQQMERNYELQKEKMAQEEDAAKIAGVSQLVSTAAIGHMAFPGVGKAIGGGAQKLLGLVPSGGAAGIAPAAGPAISPGYQAAATQAAEGVTQAAAPGLGATAGAGAVGGFLGGALVRALPGKQGDAGSVIGGVGGGAVAGGVVGGPVGAVIGGVIGGAVGAVKAIKD